MSRIPWSRIVTLLLLAGALTAARLAWQEWRRAVVIVEWSTASELDTVGFNLYRSESEAGPYTLVNEALIPAAGDALAGSTYRYEDRNVRAGRTYYYELEDVSASGAGGTRHGPIVVQARPQVGGAAAVAALLLGGAWFLWAWRRPVRSAEDAPA